MPDKWVTHEYESFTIPLYMRAKELANQVDTVIYPKIVMSSVYKITQANKDIKSFKKKYQKLYTRIDSNKNYKKYWDLKKAEDRLGDIDGFFYLEARGWIGYFHVNTQRFIVTAVLSLHESQPRPISLRATLTRIMKHNEELGNNWKHEGGYISKPRNSK